MDLLAERESWSRQQIEEYQLARINATWSRALRCVPFYRDLSRKLDLPEHFESLREFSETLPPLEKSTVKSRASQLLATAPSPGRWHFTGGSSGTPMAVYKEHQAHRAALVSQYRFRQMYGVSPFDRTAFVWGHSMSFAPGLRGAIARLWQPLEDRLRSRRRYSAYRLGSSDLEEYLRDMVEFRPAVIYSYSSAALLLAQVAAGREWSLPSLRVAIVTSEPASPEMLKAITAGLNVPAAVEYGAAECGLIAYQAPDGLLRVREDLVRVETRRDGDVHEILITVLENPSFPLFRYRIGDMTDAEVSTPERGFATLGRILGRDNDVLTTARGSRVHSEAVTHALEHLPEIIRFSARQDSSGKVTVWIETNGTPQAHALERTKTRLSQVLDGQAVEFCSVDVIPPTGSGKHRWIVSELA
jgi:phenylacetate-CoA ligase